MMALRIVALSLAFVAGIVLTHIVGAQLPAPFLVAAALLGLLFTLLLLRREQRWDPPPVWAVVAATAIMGLPLGYWRTTQRLAHTVAGPLAQVLSGLDSGVQLQLRGTIAAEPELRSRGRTDLRLRVEALRQTDDEGWLTIAPCDVLVRAQGRARNGEHIGDLQALSDPRAYGYRIRLRTVYRPLRTQHNPGGFDQQAFLFQNGYVAEFRTQVADIDILESSRGWLLTECALAVKRRFLKTYRETIRAPASWLVAAATLGARRAVEGRTFAGRDIAGTFRHAGVGHVLAVSGLHVSVVSLLLYSLFRLGGLRPRVFAPFLVFLLVVFALLTGARPSSVRAVIMNSVILAAFAYYGYSFRKATYVGLSLSAVLILAVNPLVLFSPSFLLSFGAVLSLVIIAPPLDRWLCRLHGFALVFSALWFLGLLCLCVWRFPLLLRPGPWVVLGSLLWLSVLAGARLNDCWPASWKVGLEAVPTPLRMFLSAQLAIQVGMMIPLSAWFFGQFPVAGVVVNLVAIPAVAILVQLGIMVGIAGLVPAVGTYLALPFGAGATVVGHLFFGLAYAGTVLFPFPATPKPTMGWMVGYYAGLGAVLSIGLWGSRVQRRAYAAWQRPRLRRCAAVAVWALPVLGIAWAPLAALRSRTDRVVGITCLAARQYPVVTMIDDSGHAMVVNAGGSFVGRNVLFSALRTQGVAVVDRVVLASPAPEAGTAGLAEFARKMKVSEALLPMMPQDPTQFLEAVGDDYVLWKAKGGEPWAIEYNSAYQALTAVAQDRGIRLATFSPGTTLTWADMEVRILPGPAKLPKRFVSAAKTALVELRLGGLRWLVVTDSLPEVIAEAVPAGALAYDVLVLPDFTTRASCIPLLDAAVRAARPRVVILSGDRTPRGFDPPAWADQHGTFQLFHTATDGAVEAKALSRGGIEISGRLSGRTTRLAPVAPFPAN